MKHTSITISGSRLHSKIEVNQEEFYLIVNFIWNKLETEGKGSTDQPKNFRQHLNPGSITVETLHNEETVEVAFNTHVQFAQLIQSEIQVHLSKFESQRQHWENSLKMTLCACGLAEMEEGGES